MEIDTSTKWIDISTKKKSKACFCRLKCVGERRSSSDGSIYYSYSLEDGSCCSYTNTWLPPKIAQLGETVVLVHPNTKEEQRWIVVSKGQPRWLNEYGQVLFGAGHAGR